MAVVLGAPLCGDVCWQDSLGEKGLLNHNMRPKHAPASLPVLGYFSIPGCKTPALIHPSISSSIPGQKGKEIMNLLLLKKNLVFGHKKSQERAFPVQPIHLCCNLFRERHPQPLPGRLVLAFSRAAVLFIFKMKRLFCDLSE